MSGFVSKISAAGSKGWTGLQSLWERDNKTPLNNASDSGPPPEKTSLLNLALPSRHPKGSRLLSEDEDCVDSPPEDNTTDSSTNSAAATATSSSTSTTTTTTTQPLPKIKTPTPTPTNCSPRTHLKAEKNAAPSPPAAEWSTFGEDDTDMWLKEDSAHRGILDTDKKKSTRESKRPSPRFKHKMAGASSPKASDKRHGDRGEKGFSPLGKLKGAAFGKLLDSEEREVGVGASFTNAGCDNKVWADDDEDDDEAQWKMIEQRATPQNK